MVSKEYLRFFQKYYRDSSLRVDGLTPNQQRALRGKASIYLSRTKKQMIEDMEALATLASLLPEKHLAEVLTEENVDKLSSALLTQSRKKSGKTDPNRPGMIDREYRIAAMLMEKGLAKSFERLWIENENNMALTDLVQQQVRQIILILRYPGRHVSGVGMDYDYSPEWYQHLREEERLESSRSRPK